MLWNAIYAADAIAIAGFAASYYFRCYRKGYYMDFWHLQLFFICILPNFIMLPFARSELNAVVLRQDTLGVISVLPQVFAVTFVGFMAFLLGGSLWRLRLGLGLRQTAMRIMDVLPGCSRMLMSSRSLLVFQSLLCFILQATILAVYFAHEGFGFNLRAFTYTNTSLRPVVLTISNYSSVIASHSFARYMARKEKSLLACVVMLSFGLLFFGARASVLFIFMNVTVCYLIQVRRRVRLIRLVGIGGSVLLASLYLGNVRGGEYSPAVFAGMLIELLFYGNNFVDLRDFAWIYSKWDHGFWLGRTYLSALFSFVPRFLSHFRDTWAVGVIVDTTVGIDPELHPGLRPGSFGEGYFNFGLAGVIVVGLVLGIVARRVDSDVKEALSGARPSMITAFASTILLDAAAHVASSGNFSGFYNLMGIFLFSWVCLGLMQIYTRAKLRSGIETS